MTGYIRLEAIGKLIAFVFIAIAGIIIHIYFGHSVKDMIMALLVFSLSFTVGLALGLSGGRNAKGELEEEE